MFQRCDRNIWKYKSKTYNSIKVGVEGSHVTTKWNTGIKRVRHEDTENVI